MPSFCSDVNIKEPILVENAERYVIFPIQHADIWQFYLKAKASFWDVSEIEVERDISDWENKLSQPERDFIKNILAFFAASDGIVNENLALRFHNEVQYAEARCFYGFQIMMENIHNETYSLLIDTLVSCTEEKARLFQGVNGIPSVAAKAEWTKRWIEEGSFAERLIAFACVEGIFFSASFCAIFWLKKRGLMMHGLGKSNELIARDEGLHRDFAALLYREHIIQKLPQDRVHSIVGEAVDLEQEFVRESLPVDLIGMNSNLMEEYVCFVADHLLKQLMLDPLYSTPNPFDFMENISLEGKTNFFEGRVAEYQKSGVMSQRATMQFTTEAEF